MSSYADDGISEVVGFICILVLITVVLAVWAAGSVPAGELWEDQISDETAAVQFSDMKLAMDLLWITGDPGDLRLVILDAGSFSVGTSDAVIHVSRNDTAAASYTPLKLVYLPGPAATNRFALAVDSGAVIQMTRETTLMLLPPSVVADRDTVCITVPVLTSPSVEIVKADPLAVTFYLQNIRENRFDNVTISVTGDPLLWNALSRELGDSVRYNLTVREVLYRIEVA